MTPERWKQIEELYQAAIGCGPAERAVLFAQASSEVRDEVMEMLARQAEENILDRPAWENETAGRTTHAPFGPGTQLGHYRLEASIGAGGMGEVYRATDTRLDRKVAVKAVRAKVWAQSMETRLLAEARAASALNHPNIVTIYDVGASQGVPYIVMEWVEGQTLRQKLNPGPLGIAEVVAIACQIADALTAAHEQGILHRDLKPENIMITPDDRVKVLDFGIAKRLYTQVPDATQTLEALTLPGAVIGTPGYMSPEQARGEKLDFRSDQFSFGALVYEMAAGRRAFPGKSAADVQAAILFQQPEPLRRLNPQVPAPLQWTIERCLAKTPEERFASTGELQKSLAALGTRGYERGLTLAPVYSLPAPRTTLIGREDELACLRELLEDLHLRVLTLTGAGGIGKTRLAIELGRQLQGAFSGGVCFVQLTKVNQAGLVPSEVARALGVLPMPEQTAEAAVAEHLRRLAGPLLLLLDNFEHVQDAAGFVAGLQSDALKIVVTSRAALHIYGEREFAVPSLLSSEILPGAAGVQSPAVRLFMERAPGLRGGAALDADQMRLVAQICGRLDGLPLAIELAAARTKLLPLKALLERLEDPLRVLVGGARDLPHRQQTMRATLDWSYNLLDPEHQKLFRRMATFVGGATIDAIEAVCDTRQDLHVDLWDAIEVLVDNSLVRRAGSEDAEPRFTLPETMRQYGRERLAEAGDEAYSRKAHAAYFLVLAEEEAPRLRRERDGKHRFDLELGNFRAAMDWLAAAGNAEWGLRLLIALGPYLFSLRLMQETLDRISGLLALPSAANFPRLSNWANYWRADFLSELDHAPALDLYRAAFVNFEEARDPLGMLFCATRTGFNLRRTPAELPEARHWCERAVEFARVAGDASILAGTLSNLADVVKDLGQYEYARALYLETMRLFEDAGDQENAAWSLSHQADLCRQQGDDGQARVHYQQALARFRALGIPHGTASCLYDLAGLAATAGDLAEAQRLYRECIVLYGPQSKADLPRVLEAFACLALQFQDPERALTLAGAAAAMRQRYTLRSFGSSHHVAIEQKIDAARNQAGPSAAASWMKGWNMRPEEAIDLALEN
ncbi:MAG: protein kinase [Bryobacteraceae bacterium]|jgi:predicted ATPase/tRNA A-37 threonylcarbamoyl transferase component Bud32